MILLCYVVSQSTKKDLIERYDFSSNKTKVIHSGISKSIFRPKESELDLFRKENNLPDDFILFMGKLEPRKNISGLIRSFNLLKGLCEFKNLNLVICL